MTAPASYLTTLLQTLGPAPTPHEVVDALVPESADLVQLFVRAGDVLNLVAFRHIHEEYHTLLQQLVQIHRPSIDHPTDPVAGVLRTGEARLSSWVKRQHVERATADNRVHAIFDAIQPRAIVVVPLAREGVRYGALVVVMSESRRRLIQDDLEFLEEFAARVGPVIQLP